MDVNDRLTRLKDTLIDLGFLVTEGHLGLASRMAPNVMEAGGGSRSSTGL